MDINDTTILSGDAATIRAPSTVSEWLANGLWQLGIRRAFGVCGGAQALLWAAFSQRLAVLHFRHESGAAFAAAEAYFATGEPVVVFTTTGPGLTNALTGLIAARTEGAKIIVVSAHAAAAHRGRGGIQETSGYTMPGSALFEAGPWFHDAVVMESPEQLGVVLRRLQAGLRRPAGYIAHVSIPNPIQAAKPAGALPDLGASSWPGQAAAFGAGVDEAAVVRCRDLLLEGSFAIWAGFGATQAAGLVRALAEKAGAPVMCSPRAKGVFPERHPLFVGVTGMGGHTGAAVALMREFAPTRTLVLGTRLGEPTSFWNTALVPAKGFIHVDVDPAVPGCAYPTADTVAVQADVGDFLRRLLLIWPDRPPQPVPAIRPPHPTVSGTPRADRVRPSQLMRAIQETVVDRSNAVVLAESGNSFTWATHHLRFDDPGRYRVSTNLGSMGHVAAGVLGAASVRKAVAIVGDGSMMMNCELNTAAKGQLGAVWIVLNDGRYNMCHQGMQALNMAGQADACFPPADFAAIARGNGVPGRRVGSELELADALNEAMAAVGPFVLDVLIDADEPAPSNGRNEGLKASSNVAPDESMSFPVIKN